MQSNALHLHNHLRQRTAYIMIFDHAVLLCILFIAPFSRGMDQAEMADLAKKLHEVCVSKTGVAEDLISAVNNDKQFADDEKLKCYMMCIMHEYGGIDDDGIVNVDTQISIVPDDMRSAWEPVIRNCDTQKGSSPCENAWLTHKCYAEQPEYHLI